MKREDDAIISDLVDRLFAEHDHLRVQNLYLYDAIGSALACIRSDSLGMAIYLLEKAMGGKPMREPEPPPPPEPENNPDKGGKPGDEGPSPL